MYTSTFPFYDILQLILIAAIKYSGEKSRERFPKDDLSRLYSNFVGRLSKGRPATQLEVEARQLIFQTWRSHSSTQACSISLARFGCRRTKTGNRQFPPDFHFVRYNYEEANRDEENPMADSDFAISRGQIVEMASCIMLSRHQRFQIHQ